MPGHSELPATPQHLSVNMVDSQELTNLQNHAHIEGDLADDGFEIPELPSGRLLDLALLSAWGDPYFVGLAAIEIFTDEGLRITADDTEYVSHTPDLKLCTYSYIHTPIYNQIGSNVTESNGDLQLLLTSRLYSSCTDPATMWSCRYRHENDDADNGDPNFSFVTPRITIVLKSAIRIGMMRIWVGTSLNFSLYPFHCVYFPTLRTILIPVFTRLEAYD